MTPEWRLIWQYYATPYAVRFQQLLSEQAYQSLPYKYKKITSKTSFSKPSFLPNGDMVHVIVCLCFLLQVWSRYQGVSGTQETRINAKSEYFRSNVWELVKAGNKAITSLSELTDGVFSLQLLAERSDCGAGTVFLTTFHDWHVPWYSNYTCVFYRR